MRAPVFFALALGATIGAGCGGSNSETPWPVEPDDVDLEPEGEARRDRELSGPAAPAGEPPAPTTVAPAEALPDPPAAPAGSVLAPGTAPTSAPPTTQF